MALDAASLLNADAITAEADADTAVTSLTERQQFRPARFAHCFEAWPAA